MTAPKKFDYQIQYKDQTYRIVEWTKAEFKQMGRQEVSQVISNTRKWSIKIHLNSLV